MQEFKHSYKRKGISGVSHAPPKFKENEQQVAYNPFWIDLSVEKAKLDPAWMMKDIVVNWLLKESDIGLWSRLILGVEASSVEAMKRFLAKFCPSHGLSDKQISGLLLLGHPSLASEIRSGYVMNTCSNKSSFAEDNYSGILGGELHFGWKSLGRKWHINYNSGRYGPQHLGNDADKQLAKNTVKLLFKKYSGETVVD
jgi:hypothetical protein